jgi:P4 family phage/plasmid primase-like protien
MEANKKGELKKSFKFPSQWQQSKKQNYSKNVNGFAILTGKPSGISVIDIDDPENKNNKQLMALMKNCNMIQKTYHGFHYVYKYEERIQQTTGDKLDIRNDGGCIFAEPSVANHKGETMASYKWIKTPLDGEELKQMPEQVIDFLRKIDGRYVKEEEEDKDKDEDEDEDEDVATEESVFTEASDPADDVNILLVKNTSKKRFQNYQDWLNIGFVCFNSDIPLEIWDECSKVSSSYEKGACAKKWASFKSIPSFKRKITIATLWKWLKEDDVMTFYALMDKRTDFFKMIQLINHKDVALYFYNINPDLYVWSDTLGWYGLGAHNVWKSYEKGTPSPMKRQIADTLQELATDTRRAEIARYSSESNKEKDKARQDILLKEHKKKINTIDSAYKILGSNDFVNGVISFLPSFYEYEDLDKTMDMNKYVFAFNNGCYDLNTCAFRNILATDYISTTTNYPMPKQRNLSVREELEKFIFGLFEDAETTKYLKTILASCLFGGNRFEQFYVLTGTGSNGKGVISELLKTVFGNYYYGVENTLFTKPRERVDQPIPALVEARCKRIMMSSEPEADDKLQGGFLKLISGGDEIEARTLHSKNIVKYVPQFKVILQMNAIPKVNKVDGGVTRRMRIINFPFKFVGEPSKDNDRLGDPDVKEIHCKSPAWRDEFFFMLSDIYSETRYLKELKEPSSVVSSTSSYWDDNNFLKGWLEEHYEITGETKDRIKPSDLKRQYQEDTNSQITDNKFNNCLVDQNGLEKKKSNGSMYFLRIKRKQPISESLFLPE